MTSKEENCLLYSAASQLLTNKFSLKYRAKLILKEVKMLQQPNKKKKKYKF